MVGKGTRLRPLTINHPKPMLPVAGVPFTEHQIAIARAAGCHQGGAGDLVPRRGLQRLLRRWTDFGVALDYRVGRTPRYRGAIRNAADALTGTPTIRWSSSTAIILTGLDIAGLVDAARGGR